MSGEFVRIADLDQLPADEAVTLTAQALEEWAIAEALVIIHGPERGAARYVEAGGHIRYNTEGEPVIWRPTP